jgi:hypothetical protein
MQPLALQIRRAVLIAGNQPGLRAFLGSFNGQLTM